MEPKEKKKVPLSTAKEEVEHWLDHKKVNDKTRETNQDNIDAIAELISNGTMSYDKEKAEITHNLMFPVGKEGGGNALETLKYRPRIRVKDVRPHLKGVKSDDTDGRVLAYWAAITNEAKSMLENADHADYSAAQNIIVFFL